ncbi:hypothetical protein [Streptomyces sp. NPDC002520]
MNDVQVGEGDCSEEDCDDECLDAADGLLLGTGIGNNAYIALAWCVGLTLLGFTWAMKHFNKDRTN